MQITDLKNLHAWIRQTAVSEIVFVSALILPAYLLMYDFAAERILPGYEIWCVLGGLLIYIAGLIRMKLTQSSVEQDQKDLASITNFITDQDYTFMSFERLSELNERYTEERVRELIFAYPTYIRLGKLKGGKKGVRVLQIDQEETP